MSLAYHSTPIQEVRDPVLSAAGVTLLIKREDLNHPFVSGNKWWKLKYNLEDAISQHHDTLLTFGGAHSNHIYATAAAAREAGLKSIGIIRGEQVKPLNPTLDFAARAGMRLHFVSREAYRQKSAAYTADGLARIFGRFFLIPEGGSNSQGVAGVADFAATLPPDVDCICCPVGTGATVAGLVRGRKGAGQVIGFPVLKGGDAWIGEVAAFEPQYDNWQLVTGYHFGGYAKSTATLDRFIEQFQASHNIPIEHVYSAKMFYAIHELAASGFFRYGSKVLAIHTGGIRSRMAVFHHG